jgi:hypothetical protein
MNELSPEAKELLTIASGADDPSADDKARVRRALMAAVAAGAVTGVAAAAGASGAASSVGTAASAATASGAAGAGAASVGAASVGAASVGAGAVGGGAVAGSALGAKVLALLVAVGAGTTVVVTEPWSDEPSAVEARVQAAVDPRSQVTAERPRTSATTSAQDTSDDVTPVVEETIATPSEPSPEAIDPSRASTSEPARSSTRRARESAAVMADTLAAELALLRRARAALATNALAEATRALDEHAATFEDGALRAEREGTRALVRCAERPDPEVARAFASTHPGSPLVARVRAACEAE